MCKDLNIKKINDIFVATREGFIDSIQSPIGYGKSEMDALMNLRIDEYSKNKEE